MDYKEILKLATANQGEVKKVTQAPALLKNIGPPKKEEKSTKGINSPGVKAFLEKMNKAEQTKKGQQNRTVGVAKTSRDTTENSNTSKQQARNRNDERSEINRSKERQDKQHDSKRNESSRDKNVKQSGLKRPSPSSNEHPQSKKSKLDASNKPSNGFKIPRKNSAPRPPPMRFDELLKVAEKNQKEQPSSDAVKEIMGVELGSKISEKKETEAGRERPHFKSSANLKSRPSGAQTSNTSNNKYTSSVSNNKSNQLRPPANGSNSSKTNGSAAQKKNSAPSQNGAFKQPAKASIPNKNVATINRPLNGVNKTVQRSSVNQSSSVASKQQGSKVKPVLNSRPSNGNAAPRKGVGNDEQLMDLLSKSLKGASASVRKEVMNVIQNYKNQPTQSNNKVVKEPPKRPNGPNKSGPTVAGSKPSTAAAKKPLANRPLVGFDAAMSHLVPKSSTKPKSHNNYDDDDYYDDEYEDDDDSFIDDSFIDDNFVDDSKVEGLHYSEHIRKLFKYDKRKYKDDDNDDTSNMESKFLEIEKEEKRSSRIGKEEDLEELRKEEEEKRRKKLSKR